MVAGAHCRYTHVSRRSGERWCPEKRFAVPRGPASATSQRWLRAAAIPVGSPHTHIHTMLVPVPPPGRGCGEGSTGTLLQPWSLQYKILALLCGEQAHRGSQPEGSFGSDGGGGSGHSPRIRLKQKTFKFVKLKVGFHLFNLFNQLRRSLVQEKERKKPQGKKKRKGGQSQGPPRKPYPPPTRITGGSKAQTATFTVNIVFIHTAIKKDCRNLHPVST